MGQNQKGDRAMTDNENWAEEIGKSAYESIAEMVEALDNEEEDPTAIEEAQEDIMEDPLEIRVRSDWYAPGSEDTKPTEYEILLSTGGPASRIVGDLDEYGQPIRARLQVQDWGKPWTEYFDVDHKVLLRYARCFYFGD